MKFRVFDFMFKLTLFFYILLEASTIFHFLVVKNYRKNLEIK